VSFTCGSEQKADIVRRIQVKNLDGTWAETRYQPPAQLWDMYQELRSKVGVTEARRLIMDHMQIRGISYEGVGSGSSVDVEPIAA
jgi:hypothetical protein